MRDAEPGQTDRRSHLEPEDVRDGLPLHDHGEAGGLARAHVQILHDGLEGWSSYTTKDMWEQHHSSILVLVLVKLLAVSAANVCAHRPSRWWRCSCRCRACWTPRRSWGPRRTSWPSAASACAGHRLASPSRTHRAYWTGPCPSWCWIIQTDNNTSYIMIIKEPGQAMWFGPIRGTTSSYVVFGRGLGSHMVRWSDWLKLARNRRR